MIVSTINPATESVTDVGQNGSELTKFSRTMTGGAIQFALANGRVGNIAELTGP